MATLILEAVILGGRADEDIEFVILDNILINRDDEGQGPPLIWRNSVFFLCCILDQGFVLAHSYFII
jgi:hypothetical protein